jgi:peptide/nickel transport system substrate-binding protein
MFRTSSRSSGRRPLLVSTGPCVAVAAALLAGCSEAPVGGSSSTPGVTSLTVGLGQNPDTLDPGATGLIGSSQVDQQIFDTLIWRLPGNDKWFPGLAEDFSISGDGRVYTFKLRRDVTFHDGTPFNAAAVKATFDHIVDPATQSKSALGALGPYKETRVLDDYTAEIVFSKPNVAFQNYVSEAFFGISSPTALKKYAADYGSHPVGTGPFVLKEFKSGEKVVLSRNDAYKWGPAQVSSGPAKVSNLTFRILTDASAQANALSTGEIDVAQTLTPQDVASAVSAGKTAATAPSRGIPYGFLINVDKPPTNDLAVRQALEFGFDRAGVLNTLFQGQYEAASSVLTPNTPGFDQKQALYKYDPARAEQLLSQAGWVKGGDGMYAKGGQPLAVNMVNISGFGFSGIAQLLQAQMKKIGVAVTISDQAFPAVATSYNQGQSNTADWFFYAADPYALKTVFGCDQVKSGFNWSHYCNPAIDAGIEEANSTVDDAKRTSAYASIVQTLMEQAVFLPIRDLKTIVVADKKVGKLLFTVSGQPLFAAAGS